MLGYGFISPPPTSFTRYFIKDDFIDTSWLRRTEKTHVFRG